MGAGLLAAIAGLARPILARVLLALGLSVVTLGGAAAVVSQLKTLVLSSVGYGGLTAAIQIAGLADVWVALGMVFGAATFTVTLFGLTKAVKIASGG